MSSGTKSTYTEGLYKPSGAAPTTGMLYGNQSKKLLSQAYAETDADRKAEARKAKWDANGDGMVDQEEAELAEEALARCQENLVDLILMMRDKIRQNTASGYTNRELKNVFKKFDADKSGTCDWYEFDKSLMELGINTTLDEMEQLMSLFDSDGSGFVEYEEFCAWMDDRVALDTSKMRAIIATAVPSKAGPPPGPSKAYMQAWLKTHKVDVATLARSQATEDTQAALYENRTKFTSMGTLVGDKQKVEKSQKNRANAKAAAIALVKEKLGMVAGQEDIEQVQAAFKTFDQNGDGIISWEEFVQGMNVTLEAELETPELMKIMKEFDVNCDGSLEYEEFLGCLLPEHGADAVDLAFRRATSMRRQELKSRGISRAGKHPGASLHQPLRKRNPTAEV